MPTAERDGPFRPLAEDPVVRAILLVLGGTGALATARTSSRLRVDDGAGEASAPAGNFPRPA